MHLLNLRLNMHVTGRSRRAVAQDVKLAVYIEGLVGTEKQHVVCHSLLLQANKKKCREANVIKLMA